MTQRTWTYLTLVPVSLIVAVLAGILAREPIERAIFERRAHDALGIDVAVGSAVYGGGTWIVEGVVAGSQTSAVRLEATRARIDFDNGVTRVTLDAPALTVPSDADARTAAGVLRGAFTNLGQQYPNTTLRVQDGRARIGDDIAFSGIDGTFSIGANRPAFDGIANLLFSGANFPIVARVDRTSGAPIEHLTAAALPAAAFAAMQPAGAADRPTGGTLRNVDVTAATTLHGGAHLDGVSFALDSHTLHGLHGDVILDAGGIGAKAIVGFVDAVPFDAAGEVHDLPGPYGWIVDGSSDLRALAKLIATIANEHALRSVHVDTTAPGLAFAQYATQTEHGPLAVSVLAIDPAEPTLRIDTAIAEDHVISHGERTSAMGVRTGAVAGVNGDYFDIGRTYQPQGMLVRGGEIVRGPVDRAALVVDKAMHVHIDEFHIAGSLRVAGHAYPVTQLNDWPAGFVTVITTAFGKTLPPADGVSFAALAPTDHPSRYRVTSVRPANAPIPVSFGVAIGDGANVALHPGEIVDLSYTLEPKIPDAVAAIGGGPILVRDGMPYDDPHAPAPDERDYRWPVIALAREADDRLLLVAADGRHPERSIGMTRPDFGDLLIRLGAVDAMALDSGGSVTMVSRAPGDATVTVRNVPSDNSAERWVSDALFVYSTASAPTIVAPAVVTTPVPEARPTP